MTRQECPQLPLVEGLFDGRLGPSEQASIERHQKTCKECSQRWQELGQIREDLRAIAPPTPLAHQRARLALLRSAASPAPRPSRGRRAWVLVALPILLLSVSVWAGTSLVWPARGPAIVPPAPSSSSASAPSSTAPVARGTRPAVPVEPRPVASGASPLDSAEPVGSGAASPAGLERASGASSPAGSESASGAASAGLERGSGAASAGSGPATRLPASPGGRRGASEPRPAPREAASVAPATPLVPPATAASPSQEFADAMAALSQGDFSASARRMEGFAAAHPLDPRAEEAAYLDAIALERAGRRGEAQAAARRYLARYPGGAHRAQASKLAGAADGR